MRLKTVTFLVPDYATGIDFFVGKLGFELIEDAPLGEGKRWVVVSPKGGEARLLLAEGRGERQGAAIGNQTGDRVAFFLETDDFDRDHAAFVERGVTFMEAPRREAYGTVAVFRDDFGNLWDLIQPA
ncbi:VOC family protein [Hyphomonas sp.]|uniref:VOC family protein n=1 Tax=Hyphomonas sp. TaxID=87 RepID=UPI003919150B